MAHWGVWGIILMYTMEGMAIPWPIEIPLWLSGDMLHHGQASYWGLVLATWFGSSLGNVIAFLLARWTGRPLLLSIASRFHMLARVEKGQEWVDRFGLGAVIFTRWINWGFGLALWLTGFSELTPRQVLPAMLINTAIWSCAWVALGKVVIRGLDHVGLPGWYMLIPGAVMLVSMGSWQLWRKYRAVEGT